MKQLKPWMKRAKNCKPRKKRKDAHITHKTKEALRDRIQLEIEVFF